MKEVMKKIQTYLDDFFEKKYDFDEQEEAFVVFYGSTVLKISPIYVGDHILVEIMAFVVQDVEPTPELMEHLLFLNYKIPVGAFSLVGKDVFYSHTILADQLSGDALKTSLAVVADMADDEDDYITMKYGGKRAIEKLAQPRKPRS